MKDNKTILNRTKFRLRKTKDLGRKKKMEEKNRIILIQGYFKGFCTRSQYYNLLYRYRKTLEIVETEQSYYDNLSLIYNYYYNPLIKLADSVPLISHEEIQNVFSNIVKIKENSSIILGMLKKRTSVWQKKNQMIGDVFVKIIEKSLLVPYIKYIQNYDEHREYRETLAQDNMEFKRFISYVSLLPPLEGKSFEDLMINPVQRIPRYLLLLEDLIKITKVSHADHLNLTNAKSLLSNFTEYINESINNNKIMIKISASLIGYETLPFNKDRKLLHHGELKHFIKKKKKTKHIYLFSDCIVFSKIPRNRIFRKGCKDMSILAYLNLNPNISVRSVGQVKSGFIFSINVSGQDNYFSAQTLNDMRYWTSQINLALKKINKPSIISISPSLKEKKTMIYCSPTINIDKEEVLLPLE